MRMFVGTYDANDNITTEDTIQINALNAIKIGPSANFQTKDEFLVSMGDLTSSGRHEVSHVAWWKAVNNMVINSNDTHVGDALFIDCKDVWLESNISATDIYVMKDANFHNSINHLHGDIHYVGSTFEMYEVFDSYFV